MSRDLVNPIAYGRTSEIYFWDQEHILKLFYDWVELESIENEARISHAVFESSLPVPEVGEIVHVKERMGLVYQRIHGDSMYTVVKRKPWRLPYIYKRSAELHVEIHAHSISAKLPSQRQILEKSIHQAEALPSHLRSKVLTMLESLPDGNQLCHGDFWGGNILLTPRGEVVIDWHNASRGNPIADLARSTIGHFGATKTRQFNRLNITYGTSKANQIKNSLLQLFARISYPIYLYHYFKLCPGREDEYRRWLPIVAAARLSHNIPDLEKLLIEQVERNL